MFENFPSLTISGGGRTAGLRLEALEDRMTPAVVAPADPTGAFAFNTAALGGITLAPVEATDRAYLAEVGRVSVIQWFLGKTEAAQGSDPEVRAFGDQLAESQLDLFNAVLPVLARSGVPIQLTPTDQTMINALSGLTGPVLDTNYLLGSSLYGLQANGLAQTEVLLGPESFVRAFARSQLAPLQSQLQTGFALLGPDSAGAVVGLFAQMGGFGPVSRSPFGTTGFGTTGLGLPPSPNNELDAFMAPAVDSSAGSGAAASALSGTDSFATTGTAPPAVGPTDQSSTFGPPPPDGSVGTFNFGGPPVPIF